MIFISYWELNESLDPSELADIVQTLMNKKLVPAEGIKQLAWYVSPDYWGITVTEAESEEALVNDSAMWRIVKPGVFKSIKTSVGLEVSKVLPIMMKLAKKIKG